MHALKRVSSSTPAAKAVATPDIGQALRNAGVLNLAGSNAKYASAQWLSAPVRLICALSPADVIVAKARNCKTLGDVMALRVAWVPYFGESLGLKLLAAQNALRPILMTYGKPKAD